MTDKYVDLKRVFTQFDATDGSDRQAQQIQFYLGTGTATGWPEILQKRRVVILGEPGSGKTTEFKQQAATIKEHGEFCLRLSLAHLINKTIPDILSAADVDDLARWKRSHDTGYLFLDSVDESRLERFADFRNALINIRRSFEPEELARLNILISSRGTAWQSAADLDLVTEELGNEVTREAIAEQNSDSRSITKDRSAKDESPTLRATEERAQFFCYKLADLTLAQVELYAREVGIHEAKQFVQALRDNHAESLATRPVDVKVLVEYWRTKKNLGSLSELMEFQVTEHLKESSDRERDAAIEPARLRAGAEQLAAVTLMARKTDFNTLYSGSMPGDGLDAQAGMSEWKPDDLYSLTQRSIFDSEYMGKIRFHHRNTAEYLAACWFRNLLKTGLLYRDLLHILFAPSVEGYLLRPSLAPIATWLCCFDGTWTDLLRDQMLKSSPQSFLIYGDPAALGTDFRGQVLRALMAKFDGRNFGHISAEPRVLARMADPAHVGLISDAIRNRSAGATVRRCAFQIAVYGKLAGTVEAALAVIESDQADGMKDYAMELVREVGTIDEKRRLVGWAERVDSIPVDWVHEICETLYPDVMDELQVAALFKKCAVSQDRRLTTLYRLNRFFKELVPIERVPALMRAILGLLSQPPFIDDKHRRVSNVHAWLLPSLPILTGRLLKLESLTGDVIRNISEAFSFMEMNHHYMLTYEEERHDFSALTRLHRALRRDYLLYMAASRPAEDPWHVAFCFRSGETVLALDGGDIDWLLDIARTQGDSRLRTIALQALGNLFEAERRPLSLMFQIRAAVKDDPELSRKAESVTQIGPMPALRRWWYTQFVHRFGSRWYWQHKQIEFRQKRVFWRSLWILHRHISQLRRGARPDWAIYMLMEAEKKGDNRGKLGTRDWNSLHKKFGRRLTSAMEAGCDRMWRENEMTLPHARNPPNSLPNILIASLSILELRSEDPAFWGTLTEQEARRAAIYGVNELNGFADWIPTLFARHPVTVSRVLIEGLRGEYALPGDGRHILGVGSTVSGDDISQAMMESVGPICFALVTAADPANPTVLRYFLRIVLRTGLMTKEEWATLCPQRISAYTSQQEQYVLWLALWMQVDTTAALDFICGLLLVEQAHVLGLVSGALVGDDFHSTVKLADADYQRPEVLRRFLPMLFKEHRNEPPVLPGVTWGSMPDRIGRLGGLLTQQLGAASDPDSLAVLRELHATPELAPEHDWLKDIIDQRILRESESVPWPPNNTDAYAKGATLEPRNDEELYALGLKVIGHVKFMVEDSDHSWRDGVIEDWDERQLRNWFGDRVRQLGSRQFVVTEEPENALRKKPDVVLAHTAFQNTVAIEMKWVDEYSLAEHLEMLERQLYGQYMRGESRYGVYLLVHKGNPGRTWKSDEFGTVALDGLAEILRNRAKSILERDTSVRAISVEVIDCNPPH